MATKKELIAQRNKLIKELETTKLEILELEEDVSEKKKKKKELEKKIKFADAEIKRS